MSESEVIIGFENYRIECIIGIEEHERAKEQEILVDMKVRARVEAAAQSDAIHDTIDYITLAGLCKQMAETGLYYLLEKYAADVLKKVLTTFPVTWAWIRVKKPSALPGAKFTFVEMECEKENS